MSDERSNRPPTISFDDDVSESKLSQLKAPTFAPVPRNNTRTLAALNITYDGEVSKSELGRLKAVTRHDLINGAERAARTPQQQAAVDRRLDALTTRAMDFVQQEKAQTATRNPQPRATQQSTPAQSPGQIRGLMNRANDHMKTLQEKGRAALDRVSGLRANSRNTDPQRTSQPTQPRAVQQTGLTQSPGKIRAMMNRANAHVKTLQEKGRAALDRVTGPRDNNRSTASQRAPQPTRGKDNGR